MPRGKRKGSVALVRSSRVIAVTGGNGFLGKNLVALLEDDPRATRIVLLDQRVPATAGAKSRHWPVDLTQPQAAARVEEALRAEGAETLVHLAFLANPIRAQAYAHELEVAGTMSVLRACAAARVRKIVHGSFTALYGARPEHPNFIPETAPLRGGETGNAFLADKIEAERQVAEYAASARGSVVTVLRTGAVLGPTVRSYVTRYLSHRVVPTLLGFDPLVQFVHEADAVAALKIAVEAEHPGVFNIVGTGVLPLSTAIALAGRLAAPIPRAALDAAARFLWFAQVGLAPSPFLDFLRYLCVADGEKAAREMGFHPAYSTRDAILDFGRTQLLRDARLLRDTTTAGAEP